MKKNLILSAALLLSATAAMAQSGTFTLKANLKNFGDTVIVFKNRGVKNDTVLVKKDKFTYTTTLDKPMSIIFATPGTFRNTEYKMARIVAVPGEKAELVGDVLTRYDISGSNFYKQYHSLDLMLEEAEKPFAELRKSIEDRMKNGGDQNALRKEYQEKAMELEKTRNEKVMNYISQHANEEATAALVPQFQEYDVMQKVVNMLSESVRNGRMKAFYQPMLDQAKAQMEAEEKAKKLQAAGVEAPDFTLKDIDGNDFTLSSLRGKYVVLDFWGSWCGWCIKGMPQMKEYYAKYAGKFEIVGIDCNDTEQKWKDAVKKHELPWKHVYNPRNGAENICDKYAIQGFPTKIVLSPEGKIVKTIVGEDPAFYTLLDELLGK